MATLATNYRPQKFEAVCGQQSIIKVLQRQIETNNISNAYLFAGHTGSGKTTIARILANEINKGEGTPIEIDAASNNGVDNIRDLLDSAKERSLNSTYKVIILDEAHQLTTSAWNAILKTLEEPPKYTIFMFCTTEPDKIPATIQNRVQRFNLTRINQNEIRDRLKLICDMEGFTNYDESIDYIAKVANGGMRDAISMLDKVSSFDKEIKIENTLSLLNGVSYKQLFDLTNAIIDCNEKSIIDIIDSLYYSGFDLKVFINNYLEFVFDLNKYSLFANINVVKIPASYENDLKYTINIENAHKYFTHLCDCVLNIKNTIKYDTQCKTTIIIMLLQICRGC